MEDQNKQSKKMNKSITEEEESHVLRDKFKYQ